MNYTITEEQIKDIALGGGKTKIKEMFPEVFETKLEVGKWYKVIYSGCQIQNKESEKITDGSLVFIVSNNNEDIERHPRFKEHSASILIYEETLLCYGIDGNTKLLTAYKNNFIEATSEEVETALIAEAKKRGFVKGVKFKCPYSRETETLGSRLYYELTGSDQEKFGMCLRDERGTVIYYKGIWSEIIKEKSLSKSEAEELITTLKNDGHEYKIV